MIAVLEVVEAHAVRDRLRLPHVLEHQRLQTGRPQRPVLLEDPVLADQLVRTRRAVVAGVDARADPEGLRSPDLGLDHVAGTVEADGAVARECAAGVEEVELPLRSRNAHRRGPAELCPLAAVPVFEAHHQVRAALRRGHHGWLDELRLQPDARLGRREQLLVTEVERAVELRLLAEGVEALSLVDGEEDVVADVDEGILRGHALAEDLDAQGDAVELHRGGILQRLGELAAHPVRLDVVDDLLLDPWMAPEAEAPGVALGPVDGHVPPALAVEVLPFGDGRDPRARGPWHGVEEEIDRRLFVEGVQAVVAEIKEALHLLHAGEERFVRLP